MLLPIQHNILMVKKFYELDEGEKTFEIKKRFTTWMSRKKETYQKTEKPSVMDIVL